MGDEEFRTDNFIAEVTVIIVSYNTRELTLAAVRTLLANSPGLAMRVVVFDNASSDGSAEAVAHAFPQVEVIANPENIGFAAANNLIAAEATTPYICLLNPDTETHPGAINALLAFAKAHPEAGIVGGRTVFRDGSLNPASCWRKITPWTLVTSILGLPRLFPHSNLFNPEAMGGWKRDSVREVDIVVGCLMMVPTPVWKQLGGFDERFFMYGEDADLSLRARKLGYRPMITPDATIMHIVGASTKRHADKVCTVMQAKATLLRRHWSKALVPLGLALLWLWAAMRGLGGLVHPVPAERDRLRQIWRSRATWLAGFPGARGS
jgi:GT2 family glycosyltransferase